jgi:hypothetical protein
LKRLLLFIIIAAFYFALTRSYLPAQVAAQLFDQGAVLLVASLMTIGHADYGKWFPFLLAGGVALGWFGFKKIRWA